MCSSDLWSGARSGCGGRAPSKPHQCEPVPCEAVCYSRPREAGGSPSTGGGLRDAARRGGGRAAAALLLRMGRVGEERPVRRALHVRPRPLHAGARGQLGGRASVVGARVSARRAEPDADHEGSVAARRARRGHERRDAGRPGHPARMAWSLVPRHECARLPLRRDHQRAAGAETSSKMSQSPRTTRLRTPRFRSAYPELRSKRTARPIAGAYHSVSKILVSFNCW